MLLVIEFGEILYLLAYEVKSVFYDNVQANGSIQYQSSKAIFIRDFIHYDSLQYQKQIIIHTIGSIFVIALLLLIFFTVITVKNESLLKKPTFQQVQMGHRLGLSFYIIEAFYKIIGHFLILNVSVILIPSFIVLAEIERCQKTNSDNNNPEIYFQCLQPEHQWALGLGIFGTFCGVLLSLFTCLFVNSQFPSPNCLPQATWDPKARAYLVLWKLLYSFHYDIFDPKYHIFFRIAAFYIFFQVIQIKLDQPKSYDRIIHNIELYFYTNILLVHSIVILQDIGIISVTSSFTREQTIMLFISGALIYGIFAMREARNHKEMITRDNQDTELFEEEQDMELYVNILLGKLARLQGEDFNRGADQYASSPQIFTIISRHMENCSTEDCTCKRYEPEFDRKFSSFRISSRRLTKRQSSSLTASVVAGSDNSGIRKKIPIKISYDSKCQIFKAEIADCLERFLKGKTVGAGTGLKLQKSFFYHAYMNSSYKALFVQLENSYQCNTFRGKIHIYHLKTRIQEEMIQSQASPLSSLDITTCLKFEDKRIIFEQRIIDLCEASEAFWTDLINKGISSQTQTKTQSHQDLDDDLEFSLGDEFDDETGELNNNSQDNISDAETQKLLRQINDDYNVEKMNDTLLKIAAIIIDVKKLFNELGMINPQSVAVLQSYVLVYRYILRDEYRFEEIVRNLGQLYRTNKLEQSRDSSPMFCDSDNYSMFQVSGDIKDLGRILRVNRGVDQLLGYAPEELKGSKINKIMPELYSVIHEDFMQSFLKRGSSNFIDKNQFILTQNKLGFLTCAIAYVKAMVDLKIGLVFVAFVKAPQKIPMTYDPRDGGCQAQSGALFVKTKDAHFFLCDSKGNISNMSQNCMRNLGLPPTMILRSDSQQIQNEIDQIDFSSQGQIQDKAFDVQGGNSNGFYNIMQFCPNIMNPEYEFDLAKGMNYIFDSSFLKLDKALAREFNEIKNRMCRYNISVTLRSSEYRQKSGTGNFKTQQIQEILLFTILINSYSFTDTPNIVIPVFREDDEQVAMAVMPILNNQNTNSNNANDEMRTSKFKEFKAQVQELNLPTKVSHLRKITLAFFIFLLGVFSLNYGICVSQNQTFENRLAVLNIIFKLTEKIPTTSRYVRNVLNIANRIESNQDEVLKGELSREDRFQYYMRRIAKNAEEFRSIQQQIQTKYRDELNYEASSRTLNAKDDLGKVQLRGLETDLTIKSITATLSSSIDLFLSKILYVSTLNLSDLQNLTVPFLDFRSTLSSPPSPASSLQQTLFFILDNGQSSILTSLLSLRSWHETQILLQRGTFSLISLGIALASMLAILLVVVPLVYPLLTHYEVLAEIILHVLNKLSRSFVEQEAKCCKQLYDYISNKTASESALKVAQKRANEESNNYYEISPKKRFAMTSQRRQSRLPNITASRGGIISMFESNRGSEEGSSQDLKQVNKWSLSFDEEEKIVNRKLIGQEEKVPLRRYAKRGHMPALLRRASFYEKEKEKPIERLDSFEEDESKSKNSSESNYSHQDFHTSQIQAIKDMGLLDPDKDDNNGLLNMYELSQAKSSEIPIEPIYMRDPKEEKKLKIIVKKRQESIQLEMKKSKCRKLISVSLFVLSISIYLAINTMYTSLVFNYEQQLQSTIKTINQRMLCYPQSLNFLKDLISSSQSHHQPSILSKSLFGRQYIIQCYQFEQTYNDIILGFSDLTRNLKELSSAFLQTAQVMEKERFCSSLEGGGQDNDIEKRDKEYIESECRRVMKGINELGLHEVLNYVMREQEKIVLEYEEPKRNRSAEILRKSSINQLETLLDLFLIHALHIQRISHVTAISSFAHYLFSIFDILFGVFFGALCIATGFVGFFYLNQSLRWRIVQIYHIVMLIPYGDRTKHELNELIKIDL